MVDVERAESVHGAVERGLAPACGARAGAGTDAASKPPILGGADVDEAVMRSLILAAKDAHLLAYRTGTGVVTRRDGKVAVVAPDPAMYEDLIPPPFRESDRADEAAE